MRKLLITMALMAAPAFADAQSVPADSMTLQEVVERTLRVSPDIVQAQSSIITANSTKRVAFGAFLPSLSLSTGAGIASTERYNPTTATTVTGSSDSYTAGLNAGIDIFTGGRRGAEMRRADAVSDAAEATLTERKFSVTLAAEQAYFDVAKAGELVRVAEVSVQRAQQGLLAAQRRLDVGSATRSDLLRAQLDLNNAKQALATARSSESTGAYVLGRLVGSEKPVYAKPYPQQVPRPLALSEDELITIATREAPAVTTAQANYGAARASTSSAKTQYLPSLRLTGGYDWFNQSAAFNGGNLSWSTRLSLSYPLFNNFNREDAVTRAHANENNLASAAADARLKARADLEKNLNALKLAAEQVALTKEAVEVAREDLRVQEERYKQGMSTMLERITSEVNLMNAENSEVVARYDYEIARAQLEALIGRAL